MAGQSGPETDPLTRRLEEEPYRFDFYRAIRLVECAHGDLPRVGYSQRLSDDPVRFGQEPSLAFAPATIGAFKPSPSGGAGRMYVHFLGMLGPNGPLPLHLTEYARERVRHFGDATFTRFLDIFNHRMITLFYRAWACNQQTVSHDRPEEDRFALHIGSLFGIGMESFRKRDAVPDVAKTHYAGRLACQTRHAEGLAAVLADYFRVPARIEPFVGRWMELPPEWLCRLGKSTQTGLLGATVIVGSRIWDCQQTFRIELGPMGLADYERMLPGGNSLTRLTAWVMNYVGDELRWLVRLTLKASEVPDTRLGSAGRLGWTTWMRSGPFTEDRGDLVLQPSAA